MHYNARLLKYYHQFSEDYVLDELSMARGWAYLAAALENDGWLAFSQVKRDGKGYVAEEVSRLMQAAAHLLDSQASSVPK